MDYAVALFLFVIFVGLALYGWIYTLRDRWRIEEGRYLKKDAKIIDVQSTVYNDYKFKTVVTFDDGFQFITFDTKAKGHILWNTISVTSDMKKKIMGRALFKHEELLNKEM